MTPYNPQLKAVFILTYISLAVSTVILILSLLDFGIGSWFTNLSVAPLALIYHTTILILHYRADKRAKANEDGVDNLSRIRNRPCPTATLGGIVCAYLLATAWIVPFGFILGFGPMSFYTDSEELFAGNSRTVSLQFALDTVEIGVVFAIAGISTKMRRTSGNWVKLEEVYVFFSSFKLSQSLLIFTYSDLSPVKSGKTLA